MDGLNHVERAVLDAVARSGPDGVLLTMLRQQLSTCSPPDVTAALRTLMSSQKIAVSRATTGNDHLVQMKRPQVSENFSVVLSVVRAAGAGGIDVPGIMARTKVPKAEVTKALNAFVQQQAVRETRCFTNKAKKLFIAAEYEPSVEVTGGTFYTENRDLDTQLIDLARQRITSHIQQAGSASVQRLKVMLDGDTRISQRRMSLREVGTLARTLQLDGVLKRARSSVGDSLLHDVADRTYTLAADREDGGGLGVRSNRLGPDDAWAALYPCTSCPQLMTCQKHGVITPLTCAYVRDWLTVPEAAGQNGSGGNGTATASSSSAQAAQRATVAAPGTRGPKPEGADGMLPPDATPRRSLGSASGARASNGVAGEPAPGSMDAGGEDLLL